MNERHDARTAAVLYTNRANSQLKLGRRHARSALADCERAVSLSPGYNKATHWKVKAQKAVDDTSADVVRDEEYAAWSLESALEKQGPLLLSECQSASAFPSNLAHALTIRGLCLHCGTLDTNHVLQPVGDWRFLRPTIIRHNERSRARVASCSAA